MTKRLIGLIALVLLFVGFAAVPTSAQGKDKEREQMIARLAIFLQNVRTEPLSESICSYFDRYAATSVLVQKTNEDKTLFESLKTTAQELNGLRKKNGGTLLEKLTIRMRYADRYEDFVHCTFEPREAFSYDNPIPLWTQSNSDLSYRIEELKKELQVDLKREWNIADDEELKEIRLVEAAKKGPETYQAWLQEEKSTNNDDVTLLARFSYAFQNLYKWLTTEQLKPSVLGLTTEQAGHILELGGRIPKTKSPGTH